MTDYDALGKYTEGRDLLANHMEERDKALRELESLISNCMGSHSGLIIRLDIAKAQDIISKLADIEVKIHSTITAINTNADKCGKPQMIIRDIPPKR